MISKEQRMLFSEKEKLTDYFAGKRVAIVGSGPGCLDNEHGFVDSHDVVVRVNNYKLINGTGVRTDVHYSFYGHSIKKTAQDLLHDGVYLCMNKCPNGQPIESKWHQQNGKMAGIEFQQIYKRRSRFWFVPTYEPTEDEFLKAFRVLGNHIPTTGFAALFEILQHAPQSVYLTGFDFFSSRVHNVNEPWRPVNRLDPICHVPEVEKQWLAANLDIHPIIMDAALKKAYSK
jgi:hypothetical protein